MKRLARLIFRPALILTLLLVVAIGASVYFYNENQKTLTEVKQLKRDPQSVAAEETKLLIEKIGRIVVLPEGESPTIATITDKDRLKDQLFFSKSENGDKVLIYTQAKKAYLYRPATNKIIDVAPVNIGTASAQQAQAKIALRNGTTTPGLTKTVETDIKKAFPNTNITSRENALKDTYEKSLVIVLNSNAKAAAGTLAKALNMTIGDLPDGESKPNDVDIVIIIGKDKAS